ncbi:MAG: S8 family serine peptidase [Candidatus Zixiibacteriota bacterium]|nr:MAG: S8 family serine peptidase [candidate division Zixibacteria bacterium]
MSLKKTTIILIIAVFLTGLFSAPYAGEFKARILPQKPARATVPPGFDNRHIQVKFMDGLDIGLTTAGQPVGRSGELKSTHAVGVMDYIAGDGGRWQRLLVDQEQKMDDLRANATSFHNREIADLNNYFILTVPEGLRAEDWIDRLNSLPEVEIASPMSLAMPAPYPGSFENEQGYLDPATDGIDAEYAWTLPGGTGSYCVIYDFEYSWNLAHQDLPSGSIATHIQAGFIAEDPFPVLPGNNHGTAVLGELVSMNNGWGTTGASYGSTVGVCPTYLKTIVPGDTAIWRLATAMSYAMSYTWMSAGDVMLIEQQIGGPNYTGTSDTGLVAVEWDEAIYNLVLTAIAGGVHVVMCAGNGYQDLDDPIYNTGHAPFKLQNHSGAIYVGAGGVPPAFGGTIGDRYRMAFSNYGTRVDLQGWGEKVVTTGYGDKYSEGTPDSSLYYTGIFSGTSSAAPNAAAAVALISSVNEAYNGIINPMSPADMLHFLKMTGSPQRGDGFNPPWLIIGPRPNVKAAIRISGITDTLDYKQSYIDYCPNGMPDFSMKLDSGWSGYTRWTYDAPVALANCFWWFDSKYEPSPVDPRPFYPGGPAANDNYSLVQSYGAWDDHDTSNVKPLIEDLASIMTTDDTVTAPGIYEFGTQIHEVEACIDTWLNNAGLRDSFTDTTVECPDFDYLAGELKRSQNIILLLSFYSADPSNSCRIGAHYVNMVGVDSADRRIGLCDPYTAYPTGFGPVGADYYNDAGNVLHEVYQAATLSASQCPPRDGCWYLADYYSQWMWMSFENINFPSACMYGPDSCYAVIEYAFIICPTVEPPIDTCEYYKSSYGDYVPNGMPDFDQKQDNWKSPYTGNQFWSWCGPVALANCVWWFDSKYEPSPVNPAPFYPGPGNPAPDDNYPLVQSLAPAGEWDDHDTCNAIPFIQKLKTLCWTDGPRPGTVLGDLKNGFDSLTREAGLDAEYTSTLIPGPDFTTIKDSVTASRDVILLLGFYEPENPPGGCTRVGGHYVTVAGVCTEETGICLSDPFFNKNCGTHGVSVHNDAYYVSGPHDTHHHDRYHMETYSHSWTTPATCRLSDYPNNWSTLVNFAEQNWYDLGAPTGPYGGGLIVVMVDYAMVISGPAGECDCTPGDANNDASINLLDILYIIDNLYGSPLGPNPLPYAICSGDPNCDCAVNLLDILDLISNIYVDPIGDPPNCTCEQWIDACGEPLRK